MLDTFNEPDVSGGAPLDKRPGLSRAVALIEQGKADVIVVAYFDRLFRSVSVQHEVAERVESCRRAVCSLPTSELSAPIPRRAGSHPRCSASSRNTTGARPANGRSLGEAPCGSSVGRRPSRICRPGCGEARAK